jgi:hypothetical protein
VKRATCSASPADEISGRIWLGVAGVVTPPSAPSVEGNRANKQDGGAA